MINTTLEKLCCPRLKNRKTACKGEFQLISTQKLAVGSSPEVFEVRSGYLKCVKCQSQFPILAGVAILVDDVHGYLLSHVKGIAAIVPDSEIPKEFRQDFKAAKAELQAEHIEEDLEAERVNALYLMNHYLRAKGQGEGPEAAWWQPVDSQGAMPAGSSLPGSPLIDDLIRNYWDQGPFSRIASWVQKMKQKSLQVVELGCGVGGLYPVLSKDIESYLGVDSSFASISLARHLALGMPYRGSIRVPGDLLQGPVSREVRFPKLQPLDGADFGTADFIVGDLESLPLSSGKWDLAIALNAIDMLDSPRSLPEMKKNLLKKGGVTIQSCPYIWHESVARKLRAMIPKKIRDSASAVEWIYEQSGFEINEKIDHLPWLFFKHQRQLEIYSIHLFLAHLV